MLFDVGLISHQFGIFGRVALIGIPMEPAISSKLSNERIKTNKSEEHTYFEFKIQLNANVVISIESIKCYSIISLFNDLIVLFSTNQNTENVQSIIITTDGFCPKYPNAMLQESIRKKIDDLSSKN